jgi:hypothetical protein
MGGTGRRVIAEGAITERGDAMGAVGGWEALSKEAWAEIQGWREAHPTATLAEIESAVDEVLARL